MTDVDVIDINVRILHLLGQAEETMTPQQIIKLLPEYERKDVKYSIRRLREKGLIKVIPNLLDMRRVFYRISNPDEINKNAILKERELKAFYTYSGKSITAATTLEEMAEAASI